MKSIRKLKLNTKLLAMFFIALFLVSMVSSIVFVRLLGTLEEEVRVVNTEQLNATLNRMDGELGEMIVQCKGLLRLPELQSSTSLAPSTYQLMQIKNKVQSVLTGHKYSAGWAVLLKSTDTILNSISDNTLDEYTTKYMFSETYDADYWRNLMDSRFVQLLMPQEEFLVRTNHNQTEKETLVPMAIKSYWDNDTMILVFLRMHTFFEDIIPGLDGSYYLFNEDGDLLYHQGEYDMRKIPHGDTVEREGERLIVLCSQISQNGLRLVRLMPESDTAGLVKGSLAVFLGTMLLSLGAVSLIFVFSLRASLHPVNDMLELLAKHSGLSDSGNIRDAQNALQQVLQNLEDQGRSLAQKDAVLSEYVLRSQLKNVHVAVGTPEPGEAGDTYILLIQIRYRENAKNAFAIRRAELENLLQDMLSGILRRLFETTLIFQAEPGQYVAKITVPSGDARMEDRMVRLMARLDQEREFAWFTVVQSEPLEPKTELSEAYSSVLEGARQAKIREESQLLVLPGEANTEDIAYSRTDEQRLSAAVLGRDPAGALECAQEILERNLSLDIRYNQLETLCVALINTVVSAAAERSQSRDLLSSASTVLNALVTKCDTPETYCRAVRDFIFETAHSLEPGDEKDPLLEGTRQYLEENYRREFSSEEMAETLGVSRSYLSTYYKNKTGVNLSDSIQTYRVEKAMELLKDPDIRTSDVGKMVGFTAKNTFLRQFKKYTGMTPKEYQTKTTT